METHDIGTYLQHFRKTRGITLKQAVVGAHCSPAALSRFERGQSDLNMKSVSQIFDTLAFTVHDLRYFMTNRPGQLEQANLFAFIGGNRQFLRRQAEIFEATPAAQQGQWQRQLGRLLYTTSLKAADAPYHLTSQQEQLLAAFLVPSPGWNENQSLAIAAALRFASRELLARVTHQLIAYANLFDAASIKDATVSSADFAFLMLNLLTTREAGLAKALLPAMTRYHQLRIAERTVFPINNSAVQAAPFVAFAQAAYAAQNGDDKAAVQRLHTLAAQVRDLAADGLADYFEAYIEARLRPRTPWQDQAIAALPITPAAIRFPSGWQFDGTVLSALRRHYQLPLTAVTCGWSAASQSRFEHGQTQFGLRQAIALADALMLNVALFFKGIFPIPTTRLHELVAAAALGADPADAVFAAWATTTAALSRASEGNYRLRLAALTDRARLFLMRQNQIALANERLPKLLYRDLVLSGLHQLNAVQPSDIIAVLDAINGLTGPDLLFCWRWFFNHAAFDFGKTAMAVDFLALLLEGLAEDGDGTNIIRLRETVTNLDHNRVWIGFSHTYAIATQLIALYSQPEAATRNKQAIIHNRELMASFAEAAPGTGMLVGNLYDYTVDTLPAFDQWLARSQAAPEA